MYTKISCQKFKKCPYIKKVCTKFTKRVVAVHKHNAKGM